MALSKFDFLKGIDFTALGAATAADHNALVDAAEPVIDTAAAEGKSINIWTVDTADNIPNVPDPTADVTFLKWKHYIWIRQPFTGAADETPRVYVWVDNATSDATYLKWIRPVANTAGLDSAVAVLTADLAQLEIDLAGVLAIANAANNNAANAVVTANAASATATGASAAAIAANAAAIAAQTSADAAAATADTALTNSATAVTTAGSAQAAAANASNLATNATLTQSADFALALSSLLATITHGFATTPRQVRWVIGCVVNDGVTGHVVGDEIPIENVVVQVGSTDLPAMWSYANVTNIILRSSNSAFLVLSTAGALSAITMGNWRARCYYSKS